MSKIYPEILDRKRQQIFYSFRKVSTKYDLASNKVHTIGRRGEWKDYVDLFFLLKQGRLNIQRMIKETEKRFSDEFNEKLFWEQLIYWDDIKDFEIEFIGKPTPREEIQEYFKKLTKNRLSKI